MHASSVSALVLVSSHGMIWKSTIAPSRMASAGGYRYVTVSNSWIVALWWDRNGVAVKPRRALDGKPARSTSMSTPTPNVAHSVLWHSSAIQRSTTIPWLARC